MGRLPVYSDNWAGPEVVGYGHISPNSSKTLTPLTANQSLASTYVYLGAANVQNGSIALRLPNNSYEVVKISSYPAITDGNRVYSNGLAEVYYHK
jgi:hypothetical protein